MRYNFHFIINKRIDSILTELFDRYLFCSKLFKDSELEKIRSYYKEILYKMSGEFSTKEIKELFKELALYKISLNIPYIIMSNEIYGLKNIMLSKIAQSSNGDLLLKLLTLFNDIENGVEFAYLSKYLDKLIHENNIRLSSLPNLIEKDPIIIYYKEHIDWLIDLAYHIKEKSSKDFPEMDASRCNFGKWLNSDGKQFIQNNSKYKTFIKLHKELHLFANKIFINLKEEEYHILISYLERCEFISLSIGTELII